MFSADLANLERNWQFIHHADVLKTFKYHLERSQVVLRTSLKSDMFQFPRKTFQNISNLCEKNNPVAFSEFYSSFHSLLSIFREIQNNLKFHRSLYQKFIKNYLGTQQSSRWNGLCDVCNVVLLLPWTVILTNSLLTLHLSSSVALLTQATKKT